MFRKLVLGLLGSLPLGSSCIAQSVLHTNTILTVDPGTTLSIPEGLTLSIEPTAVVVNDGLITFAPTALLQESAGSPIIGSGTEEVSLSVGVPAVELDPAGLGLIINTALAPGQLDVERGHTAFMDTSGRISTLRWYRTDASTNTNLDATVRFTYDLTELNGIPEGSLELFVRNGADDHWLPLPSGLNTALHQVSGSALDSIGTYALFDANLPTGLVHPDGSITAWVYPSPASEFVEVVSSAARIHGITVLDVTGRTVRIYPAIGAVRSYRLDLGGLAPGTYQVVLSDGRSLRFIRS